MAENSISTNIKTNYLSELFSARSLCNATNVVNQLSFLSFLSVLTLWNDEVHLA